VTYPQRLRDHAAHLERGRKTFPLFDTRAFAGDFERLLADAYGKIGKTTKAAGIQLFLHNETFENSRTNDGRLTYPILLSALDPDLVKMQFQMSSMPNIGDPIAYFMNYPGRFVSCHLQAVDTSQGMRAVGPRSLPDKNIPPAARGGGRGAARGGAAPAAAGAMPSGAPAGQQAGAAGGRAGGGAGAGGRGGGPALALGEDTADWPRIFAAGKTGGLKYPFIELNNWDAMVRSVTYLKSLT